MVETNKIKKTHGWDQHKKISELLLKKWFLILSFSNDAKLVSKKHLPPLYKIREKLKITFLLVWDLCHMVFKIVPLDIKNRIWYIIKEE